MNEQINKSSHPAKRKQTYLAYEVQNGEGDPFTFRIKANSRYMETFNRLLKGPLPAPALTRRSDHIFVFRKAGLLIETEMREQAKDGNERYGVYHLRSKVRPVQTDVGGVQ